MSKNEMTRNVDNNAATAEQFDRRPVMAPPVDIYEDREELLVVADVPGARTDGITVRLDKNELYLHARRDDGRTGNAVLGGAPVADYSRTFIVPRGIDGDRISAEMNAGVLRIHLPKSDSVKPRKIEVRGG